MSTCPKAPGSPHTSPTTGAIAEELGRTPQSSLGVAHPTRSIRTPTRCFHHLTPRCFFGFHRVESVGHRRCKVLPATIIRNGPSLLQHQLFVGGALTAPCLPLIDHRRGGHRSAWRLFQLGEQLLLGTVPVPVRDLRHLIQDCCLDPSPVPQYTPARASS